MVWNGEAVFVRGFAHVIEDIERTIVLFPALQQAAPSQPRGGNI